MYILWLKARFQLPLEGQSEVPKGWKSVLILAEKMSKELQEAGINIHSLTDRQLKEVVRKRLQGGSVSLETSLMKKGYSFRRGIKQWFEANKAWCLTILPTSALVLGGWLFTFYYWDAIAVVILFPCLFFGWLFAIGVGSTIRSSLIMMLVWVVLGAGITLGVYFPRHRGLRFIQYWL